MLYSSHMAQKLRNRLTLSPHYGAIMEKFRAEFERTYGHVVLKSFYVEHIAPILPTFSYCSFTQFMKQVTADPSALPKIVAPPPSPLDGVVIKPPTAAELIEAENAKIQAMIPKLNENAKRGIALMIGIGLDALEDLARHPEQLSATERAKLLPLAMRAQDSRVSSIAKVRQEARDQKAFDRAFNSAVYDDESPDVEEPVGA